MNASSKLRSVTAAEKLPPIIELRQFSDQRTRGTSLSPITRATSPGSTGFGTTIGCGACPIDEHRGRLPRPPPSAANSPPYQRRGSQRDGGSGSCRLAGRQTQAGSVELPMLGIPQIGEVRYHDAGDGLQPRDDHSRFVEPSHMGIAGCEVPIRVGEAGVLLDREQQLRDCLIEASRIKMRGADCEESPADPGARAEPQRSLGVLDRDLGLAGIQSEHTADEPAASEA